LKPLTWIMAVCGGWWTPRWIDRHPYACGSTWLTFLHFCDILHKNTRVQVELVSIWVHGCMSLDPLLLEEEKQLVYVGV